MLLVQTNPSLCGFQIAPLLLFISNIAYLCQHTHKLSDSCILNDLVFYSDNVYTVFRVSSDNRGYDPSCLRDPSQQLLQIASVLALVAADAQCKEPCLLAFSARDSMRMCRMHRSTISHGMRRTHCLEQ